MRRLNGEDAGFLHLELPNQPMTVVVVALLGPGPRLALDGLRRHIAVRLGELPSFRTRIVAVPLGLHHPVAVADPGFDLGRHLAEATLPAPGTMEVLDRFCARLQEVALPRDRPLWHCTLVHGLEGGRQALAFSVHHCIMDGTAALALFGRIFSGDDHVPLRPASDWSPEPLPGRTALVRAALAAHARNLPRLPGLVRRTTRNYKEMDRWARATEAPIPRSWRDAPVCSLNDAFSTRRTFCHTSVALADVKAVKDAAAVTLNDVGLAIVSGAWRRYLTAIDDLPSRPLVAGVPVSTEPPGDPDAPGRDAGNNFAAINTYLPSHLDDPKERLEAVAACTKAAKQSLAMVGPELWAAWLDTIPPFVAAPSVRSGVRRAQRHRERTDTNMLVSNLRGSATAWCLGPLRLDELHFAGPPNNGFGSVIAMSSYCDRLLFSIMAVSEALAEPGRFTDAIGAELEELLAITTVGGRQERSAS